MVYAAYTASLGDIEVVTVESVGGYDLSYKVSGRVCGGVYTACSNFPSPVDITILLRKISPSMKPGMMTWQCQCWRVFAFEQKCMSYELSHRGMGVTSNRILGHNAFILHPLPLDVLHAGRFTISSRMLRTVGGSSSSASIGQ